MSAYKRYYEDHILTCMCRVWDTHTYNFHSDSHSDKQYYWVCDKCGVQMSLTFSNAGTEVVQTPTGRRCNRTLALLEFVDAPSIKFIHHGIMWDDHKDNVYWYHEHTCPTNVLRCKEFFVNGKADVHGMFRLIKEIVVTGPNAVNEDEALADLSALAELDNPGQ